MPEREVVVVFGAGLLVVAVLMWGMVGWWYRRKKEKSLWSEPRSRPISTYSPKRSDKGPLESSGSTRTDKGDTRPNAGHSAANEDDKNSHRGDENTTCPSDKSEQSKNTYLRSPSERDHDKSKGSHGDRQSPAASFADADSSAAAENGPISWDETKDAPLKRVLDELGLPRALAELFRQTFAVEDELTKQGFRERHSRISGVYRQFNREPQRPRRGSEPGARNQLLSDVKEYKVGLRGFARGLAGDLPNVLLSELKQLATSDRENDVKQALKLSNDPEVVAYFEKEFGAENLLLPEPGERVRAGDYSVRDTVGAYVYPRLVVEERVSIGLKDGNALIHSAVVIARYSDKEERQ